MIFLINLHFTIFCFKKPFAFINVFPVSSFSITHSNFRFINGNLNKSTIFQRHVNRSFLCIILIVSIGEEKFCEFWRTWSFSVSSSVPEVHLNVAGWIIPLLFPILWLLISHLLDYSRMRVMRRDECKLTNKISHILTWDFFRVDFHIKFSPILITSLLSFSQFIVCSLDIITRTKKD